MSKKTGSFFQNLASDIPASIVVFLVALPLCLGIALASGAPPFSGLVAGIAGGIVIGLLSKSHLSVSGPAAGLTAIVFAAIASLPSFQAFLGAVVICGVLQLLMGFLRAGVIGDYVPNSVIKGMLAAIGIILILKQFQHLVGYDADYEGDLGFQQGNENTFSAITHAFRAIAPVALMVGLVGLIFSFIWEKFVSGKKGLWKLIPAPLLVVLLGVGINQIFLRSNPSAAIQGDHLVAIPMASSASEFFSFFTTPDWSHIFTGEVLMTGVTLALVASLETLLSIEAIDDLDPYQRVTPTNHELKAQGIGNIVSGLIGGLPVTSVIVRSSANVNSGAKSKTSAVIHGLLLLGCVAFIPFVLNQIPKAALAAVLIFVGYKLAKPALFKSFYKKGWDSFIPFVVTIVAILLTDLLKGVIIGIGVGLFFAFRSNFRLAVFVVNDELNYRFRLRKDVSFLNKPIIKNKLEKVPEGATVQIDASRADFIDRDVIEVIEDFMLHAPLKNIKVEVIASNLLDQGFNRKLIEKTNGTSFNRDHDKSIVEVTPTSH